MPPSSSGAAPPSGLRALLGPTNTGKTHQAIERMLEHSTGMIGLPLRLLAREVYDRVSARVGEGAVALVTGEEKRVPPHPRYWVCTVEAMPVERPVEFLAVDEVQLAVHRQRGHVFTQRILHARGTRETWLLGSATLRPLLGRLCPGAEVDGRPRLSTLTDGGAVTLAALPPRSVVVAFSATRVYELAERLRGKRGGAAVVIGALSPRARNAQVALFQSGEVDTLVATDAIGMGLNLDVDTVVFAELRKFDGRHARALEDAELAQIAGRAGRHLRDGRFATLDPLPPLPPSTVRALEQHRFPPAERVFWRNADLDLDSIDGLLASLRRRPATPSPWLRLCDDAEDLRALVALARLPEVTALAQDPARIDLLWQVCQIPDFRQMPFDDHFALLAAVYRQLCGGEDRLSAAWIDDHLRRLDRPDGDLDTLLDRMSAVRTWTYVTSHREWVDDAPAWQLRTHELEDRLSDALHARLVQRFVDASGRRRRRASPVPAAAGTGLRSLAGELAAKVPAARALGGAGPTVASSDGPAGVDTAWVEALVDADHDAFAVAGDGRILALADARVLGRLVRGSGRLHPEITVTAELGGGARLRLGRRLLAFARDLVADLLAPLVDTTLGPAARGIVYQLQQSLGSVSSSSSVRAQVQALEPEERRHLQASGVVLGRLAVFAPRLLAPAALRVRRALCAAELWPDPLPAAVGDARDAAAPPCWPVPEALSPRLLEGLGYVAIDHPSLPAPLAVRADALEQAGRDVARGASARLLARALGLTVADAAAVGEALVALGVGRGPRRRRRTRGPARPLVRT